MEPCKFPLDKQKEIFLEIIQKNKVVKEILDRGFVENISNWYLVAGCLNQTIWNHLTGQNVQNNINDYDIVYFDSDISKDKEVHIQTLVKNKFSDIEEEIDVVNQARVHTWIDKDWGLKMRPLVSCEDGISSWPITASCIGVRKEENGVYTVMAPYGLTDSLEMIIRPNKTTVMRESDFYYKVNRWVKKWPKLTIIPW